MPRLISLDELNSLPPDNEARFTAMEEIMRTKHEDLVAEEEVAVQIKRLRRQYMNAVVGAAYALSISQIQGEHVPPVEDLTEDVYADFVDKVDGVTMRLALAGSRGAVAYSVKIEKSTKGRLLELTAELRLQVHDLDLSPARKDSLLAKISMFEKDLEGPRLNFGNMTAMALFAVSLVSDMGGAGATVRQTITTMQEVVGAAKFEEDTGLGLAIAHVPRLALPSPPQPTDDNSIEDPAMK